MNKPHRDIDPLFYAMSKLKIGDYEKCIEICDEILMENNRDQAAWLCKTKALTFQQYINDEDLEEEGLGDMIMDDNATQSLPRPMTSINSSSSSSSDITNNPSKRPMTGSNRPLSGFVRPSTQSNISKTGNLEQTMRGMSRGNTSSGKRPVTSLGRELRLGTASIQSTGGAFIDASRINFQRFVRRQPLAIALADYLIYHERDFVKAMNLCAEGSKIENYENWWWKARWGKCYYRLGLYREAERQFKSSLKEQDMIMTYLELSKVYLKLDQPLKSLELLKRGSEKHIDEPRILLAIAHIFDMLNNNEKAILSYRKVLSLEANNIEAISSLAANYFYSDQPEIALRYYRRLLQMGTGTSPEIWNNIGLSCFYASQYDMALNCFNRALQLASDDTMADIWYNIGHVSIGIGDLTMAYRSFKIAISIDNNHAESYTNLGVLEMRKLHFDAARSYFRTARELSDWVFEAFYNGALLAWKVGDYQEAYNLTEKSLKLYPDHTESKELKDILEKQFT